MRRQDNPAAFVKVRVVVTVDIFYLTQSVIYPSSPETGSVCALLSDLTLSFNEDLLLSPGAVENRDFRRINTTLVHPVLEISFRLQTCLLQTLHLLFEHRVGLTLKRALLVYPDKP